MTSELATSAPSKSEAGCLDALMKSTGGLLHHYQLTLLAIAFSLFVLFGVEQVSHVLFHLPAVSFSSLLSYHGFFVISFWVFVILLLSAYVLFLVHVTPPVPDGKVDKIGRYFRTGSCAVVVLLLAGACAVLTLFELPLIEDKNLLWGFAFGIPVFWGLACVKHQYGEGDNGFLDLPWKWAGGPKGRLSWSAGIAALVLLVILVPLFFVLIYTNFGGWQAGNGFLAIGIGWCLWLLAGWFHQARWGDPEHTWLLLRPFARALWILLWTNVLGELLWLGARYVPDNLSYRNYSIWSILHLLFTLVLYARLLDWLSSQSAWPIRFLGLVSAAVLLFFVSASAQVGEPKSVVVREQEGGKLVATELGWLEAFTKRIERCPEEKPVVVVAASGGGSRAALFAALVYESLAQLPVYPEKKDSPTWADQVVLVSSVSGGSLASAYFGSQTFPVSAGRPMRSWQHSITREIQDWLPKKATQFRLKIQEQYDNAGPAGKEFARPDLVQWEAIEEASKALAKLAPEQLDPAKDPNAWLLKNTFADDMCTDFMAPLLRGLLYPGKERGVSVTDFWRDRFQGLKDVNRAAWPAERPLLLVNATQVQDGRRIVIGFPPVPAGFLARGQDVIQLSNKLNVDPNLRKNHPLSLDDRASLYRVSLAEAVRLSANFPWGFNPGVLEIEHESPKPQKLKIVDGGVIDNTGMDSLAWVFMSLYQSQKQREDEKLQEQAKRAVRALEKRGVLFLEIDSGANVGKPGPVARLLHHIFEPVEALEQAGVVTAKSAKLAYWRQFQELIREEISVSPGEKGKDPVMDTIHLCNFFQYHCNHSEDVMTAWAMGPDDKAAVLVQFLFDLHKKKVFLQETLNSITDGARIVEEYRNPKKEKGAFAASYQRFKEKKARFDVEQAILTLAASNCKNALEGVASEVDPLARLPLTIPSVEKSPVAGSAEPGRRIDRESIKKVLQPRLDYLLEQRERFKKD